MADGRHKLDEKDIEIMESIKSQLSIHIKHLLERGVRPTNIEIELMWHIRNSLKEEEDY